jgi:hypothetical protein
VSRTLSPLATLALVTPLVALYGSGAWSWVVGPIASLVVWALDAVAHEPVAASVAPVRPTGVLSARREPEPVD